MGTAHLCLGMCHAHHLGCPLAFLSRNSANIAYSHTSRLLHMLLPLTNALLYWANSYSPFKTQLKERFQKRLPDPCPKLGFPFLCAPTHAVLPSGPALITILY